MEISEALEQLKKSLAKYAKSPLLHLSEAAERLKIAEDDLAELVRRGKIRAFKVGEHWFMEESWIDDFRALIKKSLEQEIKKYKSSLAHGQGWARPVFKRRRSKLRLRIRPLSHFFKGVVAVLSLLILLGGFSILCLPLARFGLNREIVAVSFLQATYRVYDWPAAYIREASTAYPINDEELTYMIHRLAGVNPPGQVAGAFEADIR